MAIRRNIFTVALVSRVVHIVAGSGMEKEIGGCMVVMDELPGTSQGVHIAVQVGQAGHHLAGVLDKTVCGGGAAVSVLTAWRRLVLM